MPVWPPGLRAGASSRRSPKLAIHGWVDEFLWGGGNFAAPHPAAPASRINKLKRVGERERDPVQPPSGGFIGSSEPRAPRSLAAHFGALAPSTHGHLYPLRRGSRRHRPIGPMRLGPLRGNRMISS